LGGSYKTFKKATAPMESILERCDLLDEQSGVATGTMLSCSGDSLKSVSPIDRQLIGKIRCETEEEYQQIIFQAEKTFKTWRLVPAPKRGEIVRQIGKSLSTQSFLGSLSSSIIFLLI
jgi:aldehyde dehydrogenase (NAD+)